jgi:hypothetical protein
MKSIGAAALLAAALGATAQAQPSFNNATCVPSGPSLFTLSVTLLDGSTLKLSDWTGNVTLLTNVATY